MKNFIFALCGFLMMTFASPSVQASVSEPSKYEYVAPSVDVGLPDIQYITSEVTSIDYLVVTAPQPIFMIAQSLAMQSKSVTVPKCPFRYIYKLKYCNHYSYVAYSRLITPY